jgi:uncharacterized protein DUF6714
VQGLSLSPSRTTPPDNLQNPIVKAFARRAYPGDDRIALSDDRYPDDEGRRVATFLRGKGWREVTYEALRAYPGDPTAILRFLRDEGFLYYLPAFLSMALDEGAGEIRDAVCYALTAPRPEATRDAEQFRARVSALSDGERRAVASVLRVLAEREGPGSPAQDALDSYWTGATA